VRAQARGGRGVALLCIQAHEEHRALSALCRAHGALAARGLRAGCVPVFERAAAAGACSATLTKLHVLPHAL
jgi:hypothetical protein